MEPIDVAYEKFIELSNDIQTYSETIFTEQDTRIKVIDRIFIEVLGWPFSEICTESQAGKGFIDYKLSHNRLARLIVEAKRDGRELGAKDLTAGRHYKLSGPTLKTESIQEGIEQAIVYCAHKNTELACVTNGHEWVIFRGSRLGDGHDTRDGMAIVFPSLDGIKHQFALFYDLLAYQSVQEFRFRAIFQEAEGRPIRHTGFSCSLRDPETRVILPQTQFAADVDRVMSSFFRRLSGDQDPDLILQCFVQTSQSDYADERLAQISQEFLTRLRDLNTTSGEELQEIIERTQITQSNTFVVIIGTKGAGKSTFIDRFFKYVLDSSIRAQCTVVRINLSDSSGQETAIVDWLNREVLEKVECAVFNDKQPEYTDFQGMFFDEYRRRSTGTLKPLYDSDKQAFRIEFGKHVEHKRLTDPHSYIQRLLNHAVRIRRKLPVLVFDNADHFSIEFQERVLQYSRSLYEQAACLVILPITDRTSWQIARQGALRTFEYESLYLPVPPPQKVLQSRIDFLHKRIEQEEKQPGRGYFFGRGITLSLENLKAFAFCLQRIFVETGEVSAWVESLSNGDIRTSLEIAKEITVSPHIRLDDLFKAFIADNSATISPAAVKRSLVKGRFNMYPGFDNRFVRNLYALPGGEDYSPLLGLRILSFLREAYEQSSKDPFVAVTQLHDYFQACGVEFRFISAWLDYFLKTELCRSYDPTILDATLAKKVEITTSGLEHLHWGIHDRIYQKAMCEVTPIHDRTTFDHINAIYRSEEDRNCRSNLSLYAFLEYLVNEDSIQMQIPKHPGYACQDTLNNAIDGSLTQLKRQYDILS